MAADNELLGDFVLTGLEPRARGENKVRVTFAIDADGIVKVSATDKRTGTFVDMLIEASSNLSADEVQEMKFDDLGF